MGDTVLDWHGAREGTSLSSGKWKRPRDCLRPSVRGPYLFFGDVVGVHRLPIWAHMARPAWGRDKGRGRGSLKEPTGE